MSKSKNSEIKYTRDRLLTSKALSCYQRDFVAAILTDEEYTLSEAKALIEAALKEGR